MAIRIYTKTGDTGMTSLIGGTRLPKQHDRIEAYGEVDELNSFTGLIRDQLSDLIIRRAVGKEINSVIEKIQDRLFTIGSLLAADIKNKMKLPQISEPDILFLEKEIDRMETKLEPMKNFVLPGGHPAISHSHICRCVCRRAERAVLRLNEKEKVNPLIIKYLNRLSDYYFVLARFFTAKLKVKELKWLPQI